MQRILQALLGIDVTGSPNRAVVPSTPSKPSLEPELDADSVQDLLTQGWRSVHARHSEAVTTPLQHQATLLSTSGGQRTPHGLGLTTTATGFTIAFFTLTVSRRA